MIDLALRAGIERIGLNGSFVTNTIEPNDVDCVPLKGANYPSETRAAADLRAGLPFLHITIVRRLDFDRLINVVFATERFDALKGTLEVIG